MIELFKNGQNVINLFVFKSKMYLLIYVIYDLKSLFKYELRCIMFS